MEERGEENEEKWREMRGNEENGTKMKGKWSENEGNGIKVRKE